MSDGTHRRGGRIAVTGGVVLALAAACSDIPTDPAEPFSLTARLPFPSVAVDSVMRDLAGEPAPVQGTVYNGAGEIIPDAPVTFRLLDRVPGVTVDATGRITGRRLPDGTLAQDVRLVVDAGGLQSVPLTIDVVEQPDTLHLPRTETDTVRWSNIPGSTANRSDTLTAYLWHRPAAADADSIPVPSWVVRYAYAIDGGPASTDSTAQLWLSDDNGTRHSPLDTTDARGRVSRRLRVNGGLAGVAHVDVVVTVLGAGTLLARPDTIRIPLLAPPR